MKKFFRYDYNHKMFVIMSLVTIVFLTVSFLAFHYDSCVWWIACVSSILCFLTTIISINNQGIRVKNNKVIIVDYYSSWSGQRFKLNQVDYVELNELKKEKRSNLYGFFHEFYHPHTYLFHCDYVYNHGRVFEVKFHLKDGSKRETYFGWMYREKKENSVDRVYKSLESFIREINEYVKVQRKNKDK